MTLWTGATIGPPGSIPFFLEDRHERFAEFVERLLGLPDIKYLQMVALAEADVDGARRGVRAPASSSAASTRSYCAALNDGGLKCIAMGMCPRLRGRGAREPISGTWGSHRLRVGSETVLLSAQLRSAARHR